MTSFPAAPVVLILASGRGERFRASGGQVHKLQALLAGQPVLQRTLQVVQASGLPWHLEQAAHPGMGDSIAAAVRATRAAPGWLVLPADLPLVRPQTLRQLAQALRGGAAVVRPVFEGAAGHPVGFGPACGEALVHLSGAQGAAPVLQAQRRAGGLQELVVDDAGVVTDIDTVDDLARAEALWRARHPRRTGRG